MTTPATNWRNRIVAEGDADPREIKGNPLNWRVHPKLQRETLEDSLSHIGWIQKPIVNRTTGHLIDGHLRVASAVANKEPLIPVSYVELTEDEERAVLASLDPMAGMAVMDGEKLSALLQDLEFGGGALDALFDDLREQAEGATLSEANKNTKIGEMGYKMPIIKAVFAVASANLIERALLTAHPESRGEALIVICKAFLQNLPPQIGDQLLDLPIGGGDEDKKGQHDPGSQSVAASQSAQKTQGAHRDGNARRPGPGVESGVQRTASRRGVRGQRGKG